jgi:RNA-dependent RNA polymerase
MSLPERIANGDLDGDLYLVCWDKEVVDSMTALPLEDQKAEDDGQLATVPSIKEWFHEAQDVMIDNLRFESKNLIGALYNLAKDIADKSEKKLNDPDALALFEAYNEALEYQKLGRPIRLPQHLTGALKPLLQSYVEPLD